MGASKPEAPSCLDEVGRIGCIALPQRRVYHTLLYFYFGPPNDPSLQSLSPSSRSTPEIAANPEFRVPQPFRACTMRLSPCQAATFPVVLAHEPQFFTFQGAS
jgi:hypothetical protein